MPNTYYGRSDVQTAIYKTADKCSGFTVSMRLQVQDLHAVTPASFLEASGSVIHSLSYQQARNSRMAVGQVYLAEAGYLMGQAGDLHCYECMQSQGVLLMCKKCNLWVP